MLEKLDFMVRFWDLRARHAARAPLTLLERGELLSLLTLMVIDDPMPDPGAAGPRGEAIPVQLTACGGFVGALLRHVCSAGLVVVTEAPLSVGQSTAVRVADPGSGVDYTLPCVVEWTFGTPATVALRVDGAPTRMARTTAEAQSWTAPLGWSDPAWVLAE